MKKEIKNGLYAGVGAFLIGLNSVHAIQLDKTPVNQDLVGSNQTVDNVAQDWLGYLTGLLYLIAFAMLLWGGFNILTAGGDEEKVKKGKTVVMQALAGLVVIFLANSILTWLVTSLFGSTS